MRAFQWVVFLLAAIATSLPSASLLAQSTEHEKWGLELRQSDDRTIERFGERWLREVSRQQWTDTTGKFTVSAKYVSHDDDFKTVTLLAVKRTDEGRVEQEIAVPFEKLDKTGQARVKRIARLKPIIEEKVAEAEVAAEEEDAPAAGREMDARGGRGGPPPESRRGPPPDQRGGPPPEERRGPPPQDDRRRGPPTGDPRDNPRDSPRNGGRSASGRPARPALEEPTDARPAGVTAAPSAQPAAETTAAASERPAYVVDVPAGGDDFPAAPREGWQDLFDPREAQNRTEVRTIPPRPIAGEPTRLLMIVTTNDNQPRPRVSVRLTGPNAQGGRPAAPIEPAGGWAEMVVVGGLYDEPRAGKMVPIRSVESVLSTTQAGESHYQIGLALPPGQFGMEVQFDIDGATETVASPVLNLDVQTSPSRGDPPAFR